MGASFPKASVDVLVNAFDGLTGPLTPTGTAPRRMAQPAHKKRG